MSGSAIAASDVAAKSGVGAAEASGISVVVLTVSDRSARGEREDRSGPAAIEALKLAGFESIAHAVHHPGLEPHRR